VRRVKPTPGSQLALFSTYDYHAFITDREGETIYLEADHRRHAVVEDVIRDLKYGVGVNHLPSGRFCANAVWMTFNVIAHNLGRWVGRIGLGPEATSMATKTLRTRMLNMPGRMTTSGGRRTCIYRGHGRGRSSSTRSLPGCVPFPGRSSACAPDPCATTASRHLCPAPADDVPPQSLMGPGPTRTLCRPGGSSDPSTPAPVHLS